MRISIVIASLSLALFSQTGSASPTYACQWINGVLCGQDSICQLCGYEWNGTNCVEAPPLSCGSGGGSSSNGGSGYSGGSSGSPYNSVYTCQLPQSGYFSAPSPITEYDFVSGYSQGEAASVTYTEQCSNGVYGCQLTVQEAAFGYYDGAPGGAYVTSVSGNCPGGTQAALPSSYELINYALYWPFGGNVSLR